MDIKKVPLQIWIIGVSSMLITSSAAMFFGVFGLFLASLGVTTANIGIIEGILEGAGYVLKVASGVASDYLKKRKLIFAMGSFCTAISKVIVALFASSSIVIVGRILDRIGNGLQATPRDAFVGDYAPRQIVGTCFGVRQCLGTIGSVLGILIVSILLKNCNDDFRFIFTAASIPAVLAFIIIVFCVHDAKKPPLQDTHKLKIKISKFAFKDVFKLERAYWMLMCIVAIFMSCRMSETLIMLYAKKSFALDNNATTKIMLVYNIFAAIAAYITGRLADKVDSNKLMIHGAIATFLSTIIMAFATSYTIFLVGTSLWGLQIGLMQNIFCAKISKIVPPELKGTGFGFFYLITAMSLLLANVICGKLINCGPHAFIYCAAVSTLSCLVVAVFKRV